MSRNLPSPAPRPVIFDLLDALREYGRWRAEQKRLDVRLTDSHQGEVRPEAETGQQGVERGR